MLRKSLIAGFVFGFTLFSSIGFEQGVQSSQAQTYAQSHPQRTYQQQVYSLNEQIWGQMGHSDRIIVDRLAADFYERSLRYAQSTNIEQQTARLYSGANPAERAYYRNQRRQQWQQMNGNQQQALRNVKRPIFMHLSEAQKWPFRQHALNQLGAAGAIQPNHQSIAGQSVTRGVRPGI